MFKSNQVQSIQILQYGYNAPSTLKHKTVQNNIQKPASILIQNLKKKICSFWDFIYINIGKIIISTLYLNTKTTSQSNLKSIQETMVLQMFILNKQIALSTCKLIRKQGSVVYVVCNSKNPCKSTYSTCR